MYKLICLLVSSFLIILASCFNYSKNADISFTQISFNEFGGKDKPQTQWVQTKSEWSTVFTDLNKDFYPAQNTPTIDFQKKSIIVVHFGQYNSGGMTAKVEDITDFGDKLVVTIHKTSPKPNTPVPTVMTNPYLVVAFNKTQNKPIELSFK